MALVVTALSVALAHGLPTLGHLSMEDHRGVALEDLAVACLGIAAGAAVAAGFIPSSRVLRLRPTSAAEPSVVTASMPHVPPARAGPVQLEVLRL